MKTLKTSFFAIAIAGCTLVHTGLSQAQTITPMRQMVTSYADQFAIKVRPKNPYKHRIKMVVRVYDENFKLTKARVTPRSMMMGAGSSRPVTVVVPFEGKTVKKVRICAESIPFPRQKTKIKAQVCGRFLAQRGK